MVAALLACAHFAFEYLLVFALICIAIFLLATGVFVWQMGRVAGPVAADGETPGASMKGEDRS
jgi:hypothetical protein